MIKEGGAWREVDWETALEAAASGLGKIAREAGPGQLGFLVSPSATLEEASLAARVARGLGCGNVDHRLRRIDFRDQAGDPAAPTLGCSIADLENATAVLVVGSSLRKEVPIIAHRIRKGAVRRGDAGRARASASAGTAVPRRGAVHEQRPRDGAARRGAARGRASRLRQAGTAGSAAGTRGRGAHGRPRAGGEAARGRGTAGNPARRCRGAACGVFGNPRARPRARRGHGRRDRIPAGRRQRAWAQRWPGPRRTAVPAAGRSRRPGLRRSRC